jgi:hypothetical protein
MARFLPFGAQRVLFCTLAFAGTVQWGLLSGHVASVGRLQFGTKGVCDEEIYQNFIGRHQHRHAAVS